MISMLTILFTSIFILCRPYGKHRPSLSYRIRFVLLLYLSFLSLVRPIGHNSLIACKHDHCLHTNACPPVQTLVKMLFETKIRQFPVLNV